YQFSDWLSCALLVLLGSPHLELRCGQQLFVEKCAQAKARGMLQRVLAEFRPAALAQLNEAEDRLRHVQRRQRWKHSTWLAKFVYPGRSVPDKVSTHHHQRLSIRGEMPGAGTATVDQKGCRAVLR